MGKYNLRGPPQMVKYLFAGTVLLSLIIVIRAVANLMAQMGQLRIRQAKVDHELATRRAEIPEKREKIETLQDSLSPLKREYQKDAQLFHQSDQYRGRCRTGRARSTDRSRCRRT